MSSYGSGQRRWQWCRGRVAWTRVRSLAPFIGQLRGHFPLRPRYRHGKEAPAAKRRVKAGGLGGGVHGKGSGARLHRTTRLRGPGQVAASAPLRLPSGRSGNSGASRRSSSDTVAPARTLAGWHRLFDGQLPFKRPFLSNFKYNLKFSKKRSC